MKIALVNIFEPRDGSGDGITEYTYQLYNKLKQKHKIDLIYALKESKRIDVLGRIYVETFFRDDVKKLIAGKYDVIHITNPEIGYFAKMLKKAGSKAKIIVTVHDFVRVAYGHGKGDMMQTIYDKIITRNVNDAIRHADFVLFTSSTEMAYASKHYHLRRYSLIPIGPKDLFLSAPIPKMSAKGKKSFTIGYIGGLVKSRRIDFILKTAQALGPTYNFEIYGTGSELPELTKYKNDKKLENVRFMGFAPEKEILKIYDSFDVFMSCSSVDVASLPIEDALARGLPVVAAKPNVYDEELRARLYQPQTPKQAAAIIKKLRQQGYPKSRQRAIMGYANTVSWKEVARKTEKVYYKLVKNQPAR